MNGLYPYQADVLAPIARGDPIYLGFDPGLGKSRTALEAAKARKVKNLLIIGPSSSRYVWERECRQWWPDMPFGVATHATNTRFLKFGIIFISYGLLSQKNSPVANAIAMGLPWDMTVLDEAAYLKNSGANRTKAVFGKMFRKLGYVLPMSGTPAPNHAGELFTVLHAVYPEALATTRLPARPMTELEFQDAFCRVVSKRFGAGPSVRVIEGSKNLPDLRKRMDGFMRRVKKEDVLKDLPPIRWDLVPVQPNTQVTLPALPAGLSDDELLKYLSGAGGEHVMKLRRMLGLAKLGGSVEYIGDFLESSSETRKALVFAHHREVVEQLSVGLSKYRPVVVMGDTPPAGRARAIETFLNVSNCRVFIGNIQAAGTALTLVGPRCKCSDVFFVEASYAVGDNVQAACRVHRIGQSDGVVARFLTAHGTIDDRIQDILARKAGDFNQLFN